MNKKQRCHEAYGGQLFSFGNTKLPKSTAIFNMGAASNGKPGADFEMLCAGYLLGFCQLGCPETECYTVAAEKQYTGVRNMRLRSGQFWADCTAEAFVVAFNMHKAKGTTDLRFNEAAEISTENEAAKVCEIAALLAPMPVYIYTTRQDLLPLLRLLAPDNLTINGSGYMADNEYRALPQADIPQALTDLRANGQRAMVCGGSCKVCRTCLGRHNVVILSKIEI